MVIRAGKKEDLPRVLELIKELAGYLKEAEAVKNTLAAMERDAFGKHPLFGFFVAERDGAIIGTAIYYYRYSTWKGKQIYLEDLIVTEKERGKGTGKKLFDKTVEKGKETACSGMGWNVLEWNAPAIDFYKKNYEVELDDQLINCSISFDN